MNFDRTKIFVLIITIYVCSFTFGQTTNDDEMCFPIRRSSNTRQQVQPQQGRPGKTGPAGPAGPMGPPGPQGMNGVCDCDASERLYNIRGTQNN